ncbi:transposase orfb, partial [Moniliophthora roreri MCA 2997]
GKRYSILPALSVNGILTVNIVEGSFAKLQFAKFIDGLLGMMNPWLQPNSVIIIDNCWIHKCSEVLEMIVERGMRYVFLPLYSPDFNPIELTFSMVKEHIQRDGALARVAMTEKDNLEIYLHLNKAVWMAGTAQNAKGWFGHCEYF